MGEDNLTNVLMMSDTIQSTIDQSIANSNETMAEGNSMVISTNNSQQVNNSSPPDYETQQSGENLLNYIGLEIQRRGGN